MRDIHESAIAEATFPFASTARAHPGGKTASAASTLRASATASRPPDFDLHRAIAKLDGGAYFTLQRGNIVGADRKLTSF